MVIIEKNRTELNSLEKKGPLDEINEHKHCKYHNNIEDSTGSFTKKAGDEVAKKDEDVAEEVREVPNTTNDIKQDPWKSAAQDVADWEIQNRIELRQKTKDIALLAAYLHNTEKRGLIRADLEKSGYTPDYARRILYRLQEKNLLKPIDGRSRIGKFQEYFLTTKMDRFIDSLHDDNDYSKGRYKDEDEKEKEALTFIQILISYLSQQKPTFHKLVLQTQIQKQYYYILSDGWSIEDPKNKTKVKEYPLGFRRSVIFKVSPNGTVMMHLESTYNPYHLHTQEGLVDFFGACGEVRSLLKTECSDRTDKISPIHDWYLKQYDFDKTIPVSELEEKIPHIARWWSREGIQIRNFGKIFQIYGKALPNVGKAVRLEGSSSTTENKPIPEGIFEAIHPELKYQTALDLFSNEQNSQKRFLEELEERIKKLEQKK